MANYSSNLITDDEIRAILARPKFLTGDLQWNERPNNSCFLSITATLLDENGATIPGLTVDFQYRRGRVVDDCKYTFTVFSLHSKMRRRVYQIEVMPHDKQSHVGEEGIWYGPHQHYGERAARLNLDIELCCADHDAWFKIFLKNANIQFSGKFYPPSDQFTLTGL